MKRLFLLLILMAFNAALRAQGEATVSGTVTDRAAGEPLPAATVSIAPVSDTSAKTYTSTDGEGVFSFRAMAVGEYVVSVSYVGYKPMEKKVRITDKQQSYTLRIVLEEDAQLLGEVSVQGRATRAEQRGDSLTYNAEAFQVMEGSSAEDLLAKMPGIVVEGGTVQAQGEQVQKVLVDGKEFFDGDVNLAIKNLPSDVIASIEVFDKKSEQAEFTGFDDGKEVKTINIITKGGFRQGTFGEVSGGYGTDDRYKLNGNINFFDDDRRISVLGMTYSEYQQSQMENWNHRFNLKLDYQISDRTSLQIRPSLSFQNNDSYSLLQGKNLLDGTAESETETTANGSTDAYNIGVDLNLRHRFLKEGRTLSLMLSGKMSNTDGDTYTDYLNTLYGVNGLSTTDNYSQLKQTLNRQYSLRSNLSYTEKLTDNLQLQLGYKLSYTDSENDRKTYERSAVTDLYDQLDESLSNEYQSGYLTQAGSVGLRYRVGQFNAMLGVDAQWADLTGDLVYPQPDELSHNYFSVLPSFTLRYSLDRTNSLQLRYRSKSSAPSVTSLQNVIDNSNPLFLSAGNPDLDQQISHTANLRYIRTTKSGHTFIAMVGATIQKDYVADSTFVAKEDIALSPTVTLNKGSQFTRPVNLDGYYSLQSMLTYGFPIDFIRSNVNLSLSANYANVPTIFDGVESRTRELSLIPKIIIGSNISKNLDFTASYSAGINKMFSSLDTATGSDYVTHTAAAKLGWTFFWGLTFRSTFNYIGYTGLDTGTEDYFLWNLSLGKKFLKNNAAEIRIEAFDVLKQNQAFTHRTGSNYYDYVNSNVLQPYAMVSFVYTIR